MASSDTGTASSLLRLSPSDNVVVAAVAFEAGAALGIDGVAHHLDRAAGFGHKIAASPIAAGDRIIKCGFPIGSATRDIAPGELVHLHNMKSDYLPTFTRSDIEEAGR